jgi:hypothetical protein
MLVDARSGSLLFVANASGTLARRHPVRSSF